MSAGAGRLVGERLVALGRLVAPGLSLGTGAAGRALDRAVAVLVAVGTGALGPAVGLEGDDATGAAAIGPVCEGGGMGSPATGRWGRAMVKARSEAEKVTARTTSAVLRRRAWRASAGCASGEGVGGACRCLIGERTVVENVDSGRGRGGGGVGGCGATTTSAVLGAGTLRSGFTSGAAGRAER
jgi:hypothetical protein